MPPAAHSCIGFLSGLPLTHQFTYIHLFRFDPAKRDKALRERGLDFADAADVLAARVLTVADDRVDYGEPRFRSVGYLAGRMVMVVWTPRGDARHVISMRKCNEREQKAYRQRLEEG